MRIAFIHKGRAMLPEISAYTRYFRERGHESCICSDASQASFVPDVEWYFMGVTGRRLNHKAVLVHEYASASVPPFSYLKDVVKRLIAPRPDFRLFLNDWVRSQYSFQDGVPSGLRDMGVWPITQRLTSVEKKIDFVYPGSLHPYSYYKRLLAHFATGRLKNQSILLLSKHSERRQAEWRSYSNILFRPPVPPHELGAVLQTARYGLNCRPSGRPYDFQTSSKVLEFAAAGLPIVTTPSPWLDRFIQNCGGDCYILDPDLSNLDYSEIQRFPFKKPDVSSNSWEQQIERSGIYQFLESEMLSRTSKS